MELTEVLNWVFGGTSLLGIATTVIFWNKSKRKEEAETQILNGTAGASSDNKLTIAFDANKAYTQMVGKDTNGTVKVFNLVDLVP